MPSLFESLRRIATGQPVFDPSDSQPNVQQPVPQPSQQATSGPKVLPEVTIVRSLCSNSGLGLQCELLIRNNSQQNIRLQRIEFLGLVDELGEFLAPGGEREYTFTFGSRPQATNLNMAQLFYHNAPEGDYFCSRHMIEFEKLADNSYAIHAFRYQPPVRDV